MANLTGNVRLEAPSEDLVNDAVTVIWIVGLLPVVISYCVSFAVPMQNIQRCDKKLVSVLLLVSSEVTCVSPHQVQQPEGNVG